MADTEKSISEQNLELKKELWERGFYVVEIGQPQAGEVDYLVVSCAPPKDGSPIDRNAS